MTLAISLYRVVYLPLVSKNFVTRDHGLSLQGHNILSLKTQVILNSYGTVLFHLVYIFFSISNIFFIVDIFYAVDFSLTVDKVHQVIIRVTSNQF